MFLRKGVLKICTKFSGEYPCRSAISISNFIEIALRHGWSPVNLLHIFRTPFLKNTSGRLLLITVPLSTSGSNQITGCYMNCNTGLKYVNGGNFLSFEDYEANVNRKPRILSVGFKTWNYFLKRLTITILNQLVNKHFTVEENKIFVNFHGKEEYFHEFRSPVLTHFMSLVSFNTPWKHQKTSSFLMFSGGIQKDQWREMG